MKTFNLAAAIAGAKVVTRDGKEVTQVHCFQGTTEDYPLFGVIEQDILSFRLVGTYLGDSQQSPWDLFMASTTIMINGFEIEAGESEPIKNATPYYIPITGSKNFSMPLRWNNDSGDYLKLARGLVHLTVENATSHAKAMLGIDPRTKEYNDIPIS